MKTNIIAMATLCLSAFAMAGCVTVTEKQNRQDVVSMSKKLRAASASKGALQSTKVTVSDSKRLNFSPIGDASAHLTDRIGDFIPTAMTVDCENGGVHTSTECETAPCVTNTAYACTSAGGTVELCGSIG